MRRILLSILVLFAVCAGFSGAANATLCSSATGGGDDCYWVGATSSAWATNTNWSNTPGGTSCTCTPAAGANIHGTNANPLALGGSRTIGDLDLASYTGALSYGSNTLTVNKVGASIVFGTGMTVTATDNTSLISFTAGSGTATLDGGNLATTGTGPILGLPNITVGAGETVNLTGHAYNGGSRNTLTVSAAGAAFNANGQNLTIGHQSGGNSANTRTFTCGTGTITLTGDDGGDIWDTRQGAGTLNLTCNLGTLVFNPFKASANIRMGTDTFNIVQINNAGVASNMILQNGVPTFASLTFGPWTNFSAAATVTVTGSMTGSGTAAKTITLDQGVGPRTYSTGTGFTCTYCTITGVTKAGAGAWSITNSFDGGFNTGFTISPPSGNNSIGL